MNFIYSVLLGFVLSFGIAYGLNVWKNSEVNSAVLSERERLTSQYDKKVTETIVQSMQASVKLQDDFDQAMKVKDAKITSTNTRYNSLVASLQQRPSRASSPDNANRTSDTESTTGATGAGLYREDAFFLAAFARDTEQLKVELLQCYERYDAVREAVNKFGK